MHRVDDVSRYYDRATGERRVRNTAHWWQCSAFETWERQFTIWKPMPLDAENPHDKVYVGTTHGEGVL
jgi:hypothetical protein